MTLSEAEITLAGWEGIHCYTVKSKSLAPARGFDLMRRLYI
jgi:hypothetical protein